MAYTVTLGYTRAWLTDALDASDDPIVSGTTRPSEWTDVEEGEVRQYAGGRKQAVAYANELLTVPITFVGLSEAQVRTMRNRKGSVHLFRAANGQRLFCTYFQVSVRNHSIVTTHNGGAPTFDVAVTLYEVDYDESV